MIPKLEISRAGSVAAVVLAVGLPFLQPFSAVPAPSAYSNATALVLWGIAVSIVSAQKLHSTVDASAPADPSRYAYLALCVTAMFMSLHLLLGRYGYESVTLQGLASVAAAAVMVQFGRRSALEDAQSSRMVVFAWSVVAAAALSAVLAWLQFFDLVPPTVWWVAPLATAGRAYANIRQPNHLAQLLGLGVLSLMWLWHTKRMPRKGMILWMLLLVPAAVFTGSRMGAVLIFSVSAWFIAGPRSSSRAFAVAPSVIYAATWAVLSAASAAWNIDFYGEARLGSADATGLRWTLWKNSVELTELFPWAGCGFGQFNFCFVHSPLSNRAAANFDHAHNLILHFAVEFGWPFTILITFLGVRWAVSVWSLRHDERIWYSIGFLSISLIHALLEFPWWHMYFLLPTALVVGYASGVIVSNEKAASRLAERGVLGRVHHRSRLLLAGLLMLIGGVFLAYSHVRIAPLYSISTISAAERKERSEQAWLFQSHVEYARAMYTSEGSQVSEMARILVYFKRASRSHMDAKFLLRYAQVAALAGDMELARHLVWRAVQIDGDVRENAKVAAALSGNTVLGELAHYAKNPYPVSVSFDRVTSLEGSDTYEIIPP
jgi:Virulence factor membrane-bound polymerase, C-terminal/O-Antigen ligase/Protein glycosylation ligase